MSSPAPRRPVSQSVFEHLRTEILAGRLAAETTLPGERSLSATFACNRHAVREAIKRLQQAGLITVTHGGPTRVCDWRRTGGLDLLAHLPEALDGPIATEGLRSVLEMRRSLGVDVARLAARRATAPAVERLRAYAEDDARADGDLDNLADRYERLWLELVAASDNLAYSLAYNSLLVGTSAAPALSDEVFAAETRDIPAHAALLTAVADADEDAAGAGADALLSRTLATAFGAPTTTSEDGAHA